MEEHFHRMQQDAFAILQEWRRQAHDRDMRVGAWLLVGNGAALLFCLNAVVNHSVCDWSKVQVFAFAFFFGLVWAMSAIVLEGEVTNRAATRLQAVVSLTREVSIASDANARFRASGSMHPDVVERMAANDEIISSSISRFEAQKTVSSAEKRLQLQANVCRLLSALALGGAILAAICTPLLASSLCPRAG